MWVLPRVVFVGSVIRDLVADVEDGWGVVLLQSVDSGEDRLELHADAFGLLVHAVLHEFHHVCHLRGGRGRGGRGDEGNVRFRGGRVLEGCWGVGVDNHHGFLCESGGFSVVSFGNTCITYVRSML